MFAVSSSVHRRLGTVDAAVLGLATVLGAGVFVVWTPAAAAAGPWLLLAVVLAGIVAACNVTSMADLAAAHPGSGDGFGYGRERLSAGAERLAGLALVVGKTAAAAAAAGVFGSYVLPSQPLPAAILVIVAVAVLNTAGVRWTVRGAYALVGGTLTVLLIVIVVGLLGSGGVEVASAAAQEPEPVAVRGGVRGWLCATGLVFFAFAGYTRVATLGEEVRDPARTLRRAVVVTLGVALVAYLLVASALLVGLGVERLATEPAPLVALVDTGRAPALGVLVRVGAAVTAGSALLSVLVDLSATARAMARNGELPGAFAVLGTRGTPRWADLTGGLAAIIVAVLAGPVAAIALSACSLLVHYGLVNLAALRLPPAQRRWPPWTSWLGLALCASLAVLLPLPQVLTTAAALAAAWTTATLLSHRPH